MKSLHGTVNTVVEPLKKFRLTGLVIESRGLVRRKCVAPLISYCFDITKRKNVSPV